MIRRSDGILLLAALAGLSSPAAAQTVEAQKPAAQAAERPDDPDLLRRLAAAHAANGDFHAAQRVIEQAAALAPDDLDIQLASANILLWQGKVVDAGAQGRMIASAAPDYPGLAAFRAALGKRRSEDRWRLSGASISHSVSRATFALGGGQGWSSSAAALGFLLGPKTGITVQADRELRLATDTRLSARLDRRIAGGLVYLAGSATPNADFRESWSVAAGLERDVSSRTALLLDGRYASYDGSNVAAVQAGIRQALGGDFIITARTINLFGGGEDYRIGGAVRFDYAPDGRTGYFASAASYPDAEADGTRQLRGAAAGIIAPIGQHITLRATGEYDRRQDSYSRKAVTIGLGWRFGKPQ